MIYYNLCSIGWLIDSYFIPGKVFSTKYFLKSHNPKFAIFGVNKSLAGMRTSLGLKSPWMVGVRRLWRYDIPRAIPVIRNISNELFTRSRLTTWYSHNNNHKFLHLPTLTAIFFSGLRREGHNDGFFINVSKSSPSIYSLTTC